MLGRIDGSRRGLEADPKRSRRSRRGRARRRFECRAGRRDLRDEAVLARGRAERVDERRVAELDGVREVAAHDDERAVVRDVHVLRVRRRQILALRRRVGPDGLGHAVEADLGEEDVAVAPRVLADDRRARLRVPELDGVVHGPDVVDLRREALGGGRREAVDAAAARASASRSWRSRRSRRGRSRGRPSRAPGASSSGRPRSRPKRRPRRRGRGSQAS